MRASLLLLLAACGAAPPPPTQNPATVVGGCDAVPDRRSLRARLELERGDGAITVDGQRGGPCAIYELKAGLHAVTIHAEGPAGFGVAATLDALADGNEYAAFDLHCGLPGSCDVETLRDWRKQIEGDHAKMTDRCAALKVTDIRWEADKLDEVHPKSLDVAFTLHVHSRPSGKPPRDPSCPEK